MENEHRGDMPQINKNNAILYHSAIEHGINIGHGCMAEMMKDEIHELWDDYLEKEQKGEAS